MAVYAYIRVSTTTKDQTTDNQRKLITDAGFAVDEFFDEDGVSGGIAAASRPAFSAMMSKAKSGDTCICTMVDRLGRTASDILHTVDEFKRMGIKLRVLQFDGVDVTSVTGKLIITVLAAVAELERNFLIERTKQGISRTKAQGTKIGRPFVIHPDILKEMVEKKNKGTTFDQLRDEYNFQRNTIVRNIAKWKDNLAEYTHEWEARQQQYAN